MFYQPGIDITNNKQMFNFLHNHFEYWAMNSWHRMSSVANNVKLYNLDLSGDWAVVLSLLEAGEYDTISMMIHDWEREHRGYEVTFNGRCGGYLVLTDRGSNRNVLPDEITDCSDYAEFKQWCKDYVGSVKDYHQVLVEYTKLVQSFDRLCDELRDYCDQLSKQSFEIVAMQRAVEEFNNDYGDDLEYLEFQCLKVDADGCVNIFEICQLECLKEAFYRVASRKDAGYTFEHLPDWRICYKKM